MVPKSHLLHYDAFLRRPTPCGNIKFRKSLLSALLVKKRDESKKPNQLRDSGFTPIAFVMNGDLPIKFQAPTDKLMKALHEGQEARVMQVHIEGEEIPRLAFIKQVSRRPLTPGVLTVTLNEVNDTELMTVEVPVIGFGTPQIVLQGNGVLVAPISTIRLTGNHSNLPSEVKVDTSELGINGNVHASDIELPAGTTLACPKETTLFMIQMLRGSSTPDSPATEA